MLLCIDGREWLEWLRGCRTRGVCGERLGGLVCVGG